MRYDVVVTRQSESGPPTQVNVDGETVDLKNYGSSDVSYGETASGDEIRVEH